MLSIRNTYTQCVFLGIAMSILEFGMEFLPGSLQIDSEVLKSVIDET